MINMTKYTDKATQVKQALDATYEEKENKVDDISGSFASDTTSYPTAKAVKTELAGKADEDHDHTVSDITDFPSTMTPASHTHGNLQNDGSVGTSNNASKNVVTDANGKITTEDKPTIPTATSDLTNDGDGTNPFLTSHQDISGKLDKTQTDYKGKNVVVDATTGAITFEDKNAHSHSEYLTSHQSLSDIGGAVTLEKQSTAETGYAATYVISQGGTALTPKINIPKDFLLQAASLETVGSTPTTLESGHSLTTGDMYLKFVVNTSNSETGATTLVIPVNDLLDGVMYDADNSTLELSAGNVFSIKDGGVGSDQIASSVKNSWLTTSDIDTEVEAYLDALAAAINPSS